MQVISSGSKNAAEKNKATTANTILKSGFDLRKKL